MKKELAQLSELVEKLSEVFSDKRFVTLSVLVQNMMVLAHHRREWIAFTPYLDVLKAMKEFRPNCHVSDWVFQEAQIIVDGHFMSDLENFQESLKNPDWK
jgi:hypothetical protein